MPVSYEAKEGVGLITLDRPERMNAWTAEMERALRLAFAKAEADPEARLIHLTGAGRAFCAGADIEDGAFAGEGGTSPLAAPPHVEGDWSQRYSYIAGVNKPVIAAINGAAAGIGLVLTLFADIRLVRAGAKLTTAFAQRGLVAEHGAAWMLPRLVGEMRAAELLFSGRIFLGTEAEAMGLAFALPDEDFARSAFAWSATLAGSVSPRSTSLIKQQIRLGRSQSLTNATRLAEKLLESCDNHPEMAEGIAHWVEKRAPRFSPYAPESEAGLFEKALLVDGMGKV